MSEISPCAYCEQDSNLSPIVWEGIADINGRLRDNYQVACVCGARGREMFTRQESIAEWNRVNDAALTPVEEWDPQP